MDTPQGRVFSVDQKYNNRYNNMNIKTLTKLALVGFFFAGAIFTIGCEKSAEDTATDTADAAAADTADATEGAAE